MFYHYWRIQALDEETRNSREITLFRDKRPLGRELRNKRKHAATRATLICIFICGSLLVGLGAALTCCGIFVPNLKGNPTPWLVTGSTCLVIGVLVLLLSVEIIIKKKKVEASPVGKKPNIDITVKVKAWMSIICHGTEKDKSTGKQGTLPPLAKDKIVEVQTTVAEFACQSSSGYNSSKAMSPTGSNPSSPIKNSKIRAMT